MAALRRKPWARRQAACLLACGVALGGLLAGASAARAQTQALTSQLFNQDIPEDYDRGRNISVLERPHPEYDALGIQAGQFDLYPSLSTGLGYSDNIFGTRDGKVSDEYFEIDPQLTLGSDWKRNSVSASVGADLKEFVSHSEENEQGWHVLLNGRYDVTNDDYLVAGFTAHKLYEEQDSGFYPTGAAAPLGYVDADAFVRANHQTGRIHLILSGDYHTYTYDSVAAVGGGELNQNFNDHNAWRVTGRGEYSLTPDTALFTEITHQQNDYTHAGTGQNLDGTEDRYLVGANFDLTALIRGSVGAGYIERSYDDPAFHAVSGFATDVHLEYFPTTLMTISGSVKREIDDSVDFNVGGFFDTSSQLRVDYELLRDLLLNAEVNYEDDDFNGVSRDDHITTFGGGAHYNMNRNIGIEVYGAYTDRSSTGHLLGPIFSETRFILTLYYKI
ncbi:MAG: outer membrane beta-barrel protein [Caulobacteraceae bacterium]